MGNYFKIHYNAVKYPIDSEKSRGLRNAQLGAIHAISSFFTLNKKEAAIVIMDKLYFWLIYIFMCLILVVAVYCDIVKPLMREEDSVSRGTMN